MKVTLQTSPDLQTWSQVSFPALFSKQLGLEGNDPVIELGVAYTGGRKQFIRLNVSSP